MRIRVVFCDKCDGGQLRTLLPAGVDLHRVPNYPCKGCKQDVSYLEVDLPEKPVARK